MALDLEHHRLAVPEIEDARVLAWALQDTLPLARESPQEERRVLVAAVLRPEEGEDGELEVVRVAAEERPDTVELPVREAERAMERLFDSATQRTTRR
jgi:hypothetical protein